MHAKKPPTDQSHCILLRCPLCHLKMWVSERKLKMKKENKNSKLYCFTCILKELIAQGYDPKEVELLNINNIN